MQAFVQARQRPPVVRITSLGHLARQCPDWSFGILVAIVGQIACFPQVMITAITERAMLRVLDNRNRNRPQKSIVCKGKTARSNTRHWRLKTKGLAPTAVYDRVQLIAIKSKYSTSCPLSCNASAIGLAVALLGACLLKTNAVAHGNIKKKGETVAVVIPRLAHHGPLSVLLGRLDDSAAVILDVVIILIMTTIVEPALDKQRSHGC